MCWEHSEIQDRHSCVDCTEGEQELGISSGFWKGDMGDAKLPVYILRKVVIGFQSEVGEAHRGLWWM